MLQLVYLDLELLLGRLESREVCELLAEFCVLLAQPLKLILAFKSLCDLYGLVHCCLEKRVWVGCLCEDLVHMQKRIVGGLAALCDVVNLGLIRLEQSFDRVEFLWVW